MRQGWNICKNLRANSAHRTRFLQGVVFTLHLDFLQLRFSGWLQADLTTSQFSCSKRSCKSLIFHTKNSVQEYFKAKLPCFDLTSELSVLLTRSAHSCLPFAWTCFVENGYFHAGTLQIAEHDAEHDV